MRAQTYERVRKKRDSDLSGQNLSCLADLKRTSSPRNIHIVAGSRKSPTLPRSAISKLTSKDGPGAMSSSEIQSWIASSNTSDDITNGDSQHETSWQRDSVLKDWTKAMDFAQRKLLTSKTKVRLQFLQDELLSLARHGGESRSDGQLGNRSDLSCEYRHESVPDVGYLQATYANISALC